MEINPYRPPDSDDHVLPATAAAGGRAVALYTTGHVVLATFLGTPLTGSILMAINSRRLGKDAWSTVALGALGALATLLLLVAGWILPDEVPSLVINIPTLLGMYWVCNAVQGEVIQAHLDEGGERASGWAAVGIALMTALGIVLVLTLVVFVLTLVGFVTAS